MKTKTPVFGMMERCVIINEKGEEEKTTYVTNVFVVENTNRDTLQPIIEQFVAQGSTVITDELSAYRGLSQKLMGIYSLTPLMDFGVISEE